jgi:hypothetical protein
MVHVAIANKDMAQSLSKFLEDAQLSSHCTMGGFFELLWGELTEIKSNRVIEESIVGNLLSCPILPLLSDNEEENDEPVSSKNNISESEVSELLEMKRRKLSLLSHFVSN